MRHIHLFSTKVLGIFIKCCKQFKNIINVKKKTYLQNSLKKDDVGTEK